MNHIGIIIITNYISTILKEIDIHPPASRLITLEAKMQKEDYGDNSNYVITFTGELP